MSKNAAKTATSRPALPLILASGSPHRRALLQRLGLPFEVVAPEIDEAPLADERPADTAVRLAEAKARAVARSHRRALIIGSDQVADLGGKPIGKPRDRADALEQLRAMRGRTVVFHTAVALLNAATGACRSALVDVASTFRSLDDTALAAYLDRERPFDCAGSVRAEALGIALFTRIASDDPSALIGLPLIRLTDLLEAEGLRPLPPAP
ncbi:MAG TPA: Maf family nucleotide pyrophosphatase [Casimicrobiaceae bacterium]|nr:Maf family nucleotide pyrophosphatase [Casimicrobiaceae bacterium]